MTTYRLFPSTNGPSSATAYSGDYIAGVLFRVTQGGMWFQGYWWWVCASGQTTAATKCALWSVGFPASPGGTVVPGSVVTSGTLTAGAWNYIPLATPIQLSIGSTYCAAIAVNSAFPDTQSQFGASPQPYSAGIVNGPLTAFSDTTGTLPEPYGRHQGIFSTSGTDPSTTMPGQGNVSDNLWVDVQVSSTAPGGYSGSYRLWPNKFDASNATSLDSPGQTYVLATEVHTSVPSTANNIWFFSAAGAPSLPTWCGVYQISGQTLMAAVTSPAWLTPSGGAASAGGGWCKCALPGGTSLPAGQYKVAVYNSGGASGAWSPREYGYFKTGLGQNGITNGPISAPNDANGATTYVYFDAPASTPPFTSGGAQESANGSFATTGPQYPYLAVDYQYPGTSDPTGAVAESFWVDLEVTPVATAPTGTGALMAAGII